MSIHANSGSRIVQPSQYQTLPTATLGHAEQEDRWLKASELATLADYFRSGEKRLEVVAILSAQAEDILRAGANRIFYAGSPMAYLEPLPNRDDLPGYTSPPRPQRSPQAEKLNPQALDRRTLPLGLNVGLNVGLSLSRPLRTVQQWVKTQLSADRDPLPGGFRPIHIQRYGIRRMQRSMRDLAWFLRYVTYAIAAGDTSILTVNTQGLRGVIPEDVTVATIVALQEMRWQSQRYCQDDAEACALIQECFDATIAAYCWEKPEAQVRQGVSNEHPGLVLPESYGLAALPRSRFGFAEKTSVMQQEQAIAAAYRQVFERDITREYGVSFADLESQVKSGTLSTQEFIRRLGQSRFYRREFYEPFSISRVIELAVRHFLGRGLSCLTEFQTYFDTISTGGLPALINALVDSEEYAEYFGANTVPYRRGLGLEAQECRNWGPQLDLFQYLAIAQKSPQFITAFGNAQKPLANQHVYGTRHDPLETQFGVNFPQRHAPAGEQPAIVGIDARRLLIACTPVAEDHPPTRWGTVPGAPPPVQHSKTGILAVYRHLFGRDIYAEQHPAIADLKRHSGEITLREFVRQVAKSRLFRRTYWEPLSVTQAIEAIHRRLLGRPTTGRQEMGCYYALCADQGFYALVDALIDSAEYGSVFGENTAPYTRYITPRGYEMRSHSATGAIPTNLHGFNSPALGLRVAENRDGWMKPLPHKLVQQFSKQLADQLLEQQFDRPTGVENDAKSEPIQALI